VEPEEKAEVYESEGDAARKASLLPHGVDRRAQSEPCCGTVMECCEVLTLQNDMTKGDTLSHHEEESEIELVQSFNHGYYHGEVL
jgi:hypothetical protein